MTATRTAAGRSTVELGRTGDGFLMRIVGRGTMRESLAFHEQMIDCLAQGSVKLVVDLNDCDYLDSTFLGCLVNLHRRLGAERLLIAAGQQRRKSLLSAMRLERFFTLIEIAPESVCCPTAISSEVIDSRDLGRHAMNCHRELASLGGPNQAIFTRIADQLAQELNEP
jgi:anti-anti-sigma regulatory factor